MVTTECVVVGSGAGRVTHNIMVPLSVLVVSSILIGGPDVPLLTNGVTSTYYTVEISPMSLSVTNQFMRGGDREANGPPLQIRCDVRQTVHSGCICCGNANFRA